MFGGISHKLSMLRKKSAVSDVTPDTVDFGDPTTPNPIASNLVTFTGINTTITIRVEVAFTDGIATLTYKINNGIPIDRTEQTSFTISIAPNNTLQFFIDNAVVGGLTQLYIYNQSDGDALLDDPVFTRFIDV